MVNKTRYSLATLFLSVSIPISADVYLTPWVGYSGGGKVVAQNEQAYDLQGSESYAITGEISLNEGRVGVFYSNQDTSVDSINVDSTMHYLQFQSSIYYPAEDNISFYLGIGLGASYIDADWVDDELGFSASILGGFEYRLYDHLALNTQLRWLGTVVDNNSSGICNLSTSESDSCIIKFKTDWMNQFSANLGLTWSF
ncbi:outer membrane protein [Vibrio hepatarius]|uniref:outer membrane protein n=1 Tax=Vibrio hepatarius TaxID=171383 RepID=UPI001C094B31|nr:outer membrane beta-barrel protein [Vibrio hepatarius]MBU2897972.1 porin family protein [Vibrio hepatarius]